VPLTVNSLIWLRWPIGLQLAVYGTLPLAVLSIRIKQIDDDDLPSGAVLCFSCCSSLTPSRMDLTELTLCGVKGLKLQYVVDVAAGSARVLFWVLSFITSPATTCTK